MHPHHRIDSFVDCSCMNCCYDNSDYFDCCCSSSGCGSCWSGCFDNGCSDSSYCGFVVDYKMAGCCSSSGFGKPAANMYI